MVARILGFAVLFALPLWAGETGSLAYRADALYREGKYITAIKVLERGLDASAKEADFYGEVQILLNLAQIRLHSQDLAEAQQLLQAVRPQYLGEPGRMAWLLLRLELHRDRGEFAELRKLALSEESFWNHKKRSALQRAQILLELAGAEAHLGGPAQVRRDAAAQLLDGDAPGLLAWSDARLAERRKEDTQALRHYEIALGAAQKSRKSWQAGQILLGMARCSLRLGQTPVALEQGRRAARLFQVMGLDSPFIEAADFVLSIDAQDQALVKELGAARVRRGLSSP